MAAEFHLLAHSHGVAFLDAVTDWRARVTLGGPADPRFGSTFQGWFNGTLPARPFALSVTRPGSALGAFDAWVMPTGGDLGDLVRLSPGRGDGYDVKVHPTFREVLAGWRGGAPVVSVIRGNDHALTMLGRFPPYDFLDPDLPGVRPGVPVIDEAIIRRFVTPWAEMVVQPLVVVREVTGAPVLHVLPPPPREKAEEAPYKEVLGDVIREFGFVPETLRLKWYRCYARVLAERLAAIGCAVLFPPAGALTPGGLLREDFAEGLTHGNTRYGEFLAVEIERWIAGQRPMTTPYDGQPRERFWKASVAGADAAAAGFDCGSNFVFARDSLFAPAGSCFAQHFARELAARGGRVLAAETRHPLEPADWDLGYGVFPARFGNIYTARHLRELLEQALGEREPVRDFVRREDGRWVDQLRPRAVPAGFASEAQALADRDYHLTAVRRMIESMGVLVFTLGLTEAWENAPGGYAYPIVPGAVAGTFDPALHRFANARVADVVADLERVIALVAARNPGARILLTVSPVGLAATAEARSVMVSTAASKAILRAAADEVVRGHAQVDYFPSFEIITGAWARGRFWAGDLREVSAAGVEAVMATFMASRLPDLAGAPRAGTSPSAAPGSDPAAAFAAALDAECDERFLDRS